MRSICTIALAFVVANIFSQNLETIKNLRNSLLLSDGESQYTILLDLAWEYRIAFPDSAIHYAQKAYTMAQLSNRKDIAKSLNFLGVAYYYKGDHLAAYEHYKEALTAAIAHNDSLQMGHSYNSIGRLFLEQGLQTKGLENLTRSNEVFQKINDKSGLAYNYQGFAAYYTEINDPAKAVENYLKAYRLRLAIGNKRDIVSALLQLGKFHLNNNRPAQAFSNFLKADSVALLTNDAIVIAETKINIAEDLMVQGKLEEAEKMATQALVKINETNNARLLPGAYLTMGQIQLKLGNAIRAREYFRSVVTISGPQKDLKSRLDAYFLLWQTSKDKSKDASSVEYYSSYLSLKDSIRIVDTRNKESQLKFQLEISKLDSALVIEQAQNQRKTAIILALSILIVSGIIILINIIRYRNKVLRVYHLVEERNGQIKKINLMLEKLNEELEERVKQRTEQLESQNKMLSEYAFINSHLLRGPVSRVLGLINLMMHEGELKNNDLFEKLQKSGTELDQIVKKMSDALSQGEYLRIKNLE